MHNLISLIFYSDRKDSLRMYKRNTYTQTCTLINIETQEQTFSCDKLLINGFY